VKDGYLMDVGSTLKGLVITASTIAWRHSLRKASILKFSQQSSKSGVRLSL